MHQRDEATLPQGSVPWPDESFALSSGSHQQPLLLEKQKEEDPGKVPVLRC